MIEETKYIPPDFGKEPFLSCPDVETQKAGDGWIPTDFYATTIFPEYFKNQRRVEAYQGQPNGLLGCNQGRRTVRG